MFLKVRLNSFLKAFLFLLLITTIHISSVRAQAEGDAVCKPFEFNLVPSFYAGANTFAYTPNDFNGDGKPDVAVVNTEVRTVSVLSGDGDGGFSAPLAFPSEINPWSITSGDLNSDGRADIVAASFSENKFAIFLNNGTGGFSAPTIFVPPSQFPNQGQFYELRAADFNGDGKTDIVAAQNQQNKQLKFFMGDGQGALSLTATLNLAGDEAALGIGDLNGDNLPDIAVAGGSSFTSRYVSFVYGRQDGNFALTFGFNVTDKPVGISIANLDNDTDNDLAIAFYDVSTPTQHSLQAWLNNGGAFAAAARLDVLYFLPPSDIASGDFNNDGKLDLAAPVAGSLMLVTYGNGNGTFQEPTYLVLPGSASKVATADINSDGKPDLISLQTASSSSAGTPLNSVSALLNDNYNGFKAPKAVTWGTTDIAAADFNGDNLKDLVSGWDTSFGTTSEIVIAPNDGSRGLLPDRNFTTPAALQAFAVGDFNGDGKRDVVSAHSYNARTLAFYAGDGTGNLAAPVSTAWTTGVENVVAGDFNGDGKDDVFILDNMQRGSALLGSASGALTPVANFSVTGLNQLLRPLKGDYNEDGKLDLVVFSASATTVWFGAGNGTFTPSAFPLPALSNAAAGDFNGDGNLDLAATGNGSIVRYFGNGNGEFGAASGVVFSGEVSSVVSADFNADGADDLAFITSGMRGNLVIVNGVRFVTSQEPIIYFSVGGLGRALVAEDFDNDGKPDIGYASHLSRGVIYNTGGQSPCLAIGNAEVTEGDGNGVTAEFPVSLSAATTRDVYVNYSLQGQTATIGTDVQNASGRLKIPAGQTSGTIAVAIGGDLLDEFDETFVVRLASPANAAIVGAEGIGRILDNDAEPTLTITDVTAAEGFSGQGFNFNVALSAPSGKPISFRYATADGTAAAARDYAAASNVVNIAPGASTANVSITVLGENIHEPDEDFFVNLSEQVNVSFADNQGKGTITNDDAVPGISLLSTVVTEGDTGTVNASLTVQLTNPTYLPVTLNVLTSDGTAAAGSDYVASDTPVTVPAEQQTTTVAVQVIGDTINEPNESFNVNIYNVANATVSTPQFPVFITDDEWVSNDFDRDGKTDFVVFRPSERVWYFNYSLNNAVNSALYGLSDDVPATGDYNGDGRTDLAVFRPSNGTWYTPIAGRTQQFGLAGDVPVHGDYDNDGRIDLAVFRRGDRTWYIQRSSNGAVDIVQWGLADDIPVQADYDGDGKTDIAVFRPETGVWYVLRSTDGGYSANLFGQNGDKPVPADYDGDGKADLAVFRAGVWYVFRSSDLNAAVVPWGIAGDKPVPGNYDGDAKTDFAVYRDGTWWVLLSSNGNFITRQFGLPTDIPIPFVSN